MALATYSDLQASVADWLQRTDLTTQIVDFIALAEARMMRKLRLRLFEQEATLATVAGSRTITLPTDWREPLNTWIVWTTGRVALNFIQPDLMEAQTTQGSPQYWGIDGGTIAFNRPADQVYSIVHRYIQKLALSDAAPTNILLTTYPDAYLTACLAEASRFLKDPQMADVWDQKHNQIGHDIREEESRSNTLAVLHTEPGVLARGRRRFDVYRGY